MAVAEQIILFAAASLSSAAFQVESPALETGSEYFEGRWAFEEESCDQPTNWTLIAGGNFVSEDLIGTWEWNDGKLLLRLTDLATDEETGEAGGKFQMEGPVSALSKDRFTLTIEPDAYVMKRCDLTVDPNGE